MTPLETFRLMAAEFEQTPDGTVEKWITLAEPLVSKKRFGSLYAQAVALLAAHKMKLAGIGENALDGVPVNGGGVSSLQIKWRDSLLLQEESRHFSRNALISLLLALHPYRAF